MFGPPDPIRSELDRIATTLMAGHRIWMVGKLRVPGPGQTPARLPPAPATETGWLDVPYVVAWSKQAGAVVAQHARAIRRVASKRAGRVNRFENLDLWVADP